MLKDISCVAMAAALLTTGGLARAGVSADEAAKLKTTLTPLGAEKAGNANGSIPAWDGGWTKVPKSGEVTAALFADKPILSITAANLAQYQNNLAEGTLAMFRKYPDYRMDVFKTQRTGGAPQWVYDNTFRNATAAHSAQGGLSISNVYGGIPFPIPKTGTEAMWNHLLAYVGEAYRTHVRVWMVNPDGKRVMASEAITERQLPYYDRDGSAGKFDGFFNLMRTTQVAPAFKAGEQVLSKDSLDQVGTGRQSWQYLVGQRRVRRAPSIGYDTPSFVASGTFNFDEVFMFNGALDRYDWKLLGKREIYIPYNRNKQFAAQEAQVLTPRFISPDIARWELHRVWVVEATLAPGKRHVYQKRRFYLDEDTWGVMLAEGYDAQGRLWRYSENVPFAAGDPAQGWSGEVQYNMLDGSYASNATMVEPFKSVAKRPETFFTPETMAGAGAR
ncbi:DUF1329 domain-containing protein [Rugamonas apoptosis]|uniref:DUF1329 domain-containing protein n=1 Tax=Rugamonas apoptosis TaxID=2758570 RepID=A0A7W2F718_9BURK|nr:DUF1329 domain-containing protein [Rugamonas apoptosis]MBA5686159.1 DUF1329 domain-containing protein [Rugamonas apoptosis]